MPWEALWSWAVKRTAEKKSQAHTAVVWTLLLHSQTFFLLGWRKPAGLLSAMLVILLMPAVQDLRVHAQLWYWGCYGSISTCNIATDCWVSSFFCHIPYFVHFLVGLSSNKQCSMVHLGECYFPQWGMKSSFFCGAEGEKIQWSSFCCLF